MKMIAKSKTKVRHPELGYIIEGEREVAVDKGIKRLVHSKEITLSAKVPGEQKPSKRK